MIAQVLEVQIITPAPLPDLSEAEAITIATQALRELVATQYRHVEAYERMLGERQPVQIREAIEKRRQLLAAAARLEGMVRW